ncbi:MAG TPA: phosphoribosylglycinamide formyltransferase [Epsilonproteobacteria bacterium]|nr:phosphoribosylglycinamide formyltransferase [Campylobacterota bacterium]
MKKLAVLFSGKGTNFAHLAQRYNISLAITNNPQAQGIEVAKHHHIPLSIIEPKDFSSRESYDKEIVKCLKNHEIDLAVLAGFMRILTPVFTKQINAINLHPSLLPRHKGMNAIEKSFYDEYSQGGVSVHWVSDELDGGELIVQREISKAGLSFDEYYEAIKMAEKEALGLAIEKILE